MVSAPQGGSAPINLFSLIGIVVFVLALALSGGVFFYKDLIEKNIASSKATLERARDAFEPELIKKIILLDSRIEASKTLLNSHVSVSELFNALSSVTLKSIRFRDFSFSYLAKDKVSISMKGQAQSFAGVALQSDLFNQQKYLKDTLIGDLSLEPTGTIGFTVTSTIDPSLVSYSESLKPSTPASQGSEPAQSSSATSSSQTTNQ
jgi:hypothetical protein